ncbi:ABC transporter substrate-binding protein [Nocardioidaceae bacterium SCSIO 66511]|nr:ABC transporter substrate-binding protein [Nocardioidaceae bacterium SCSIO 66511]
MSPLLNRHRARIGLAAAVATVSALVAAGCGTSDDAPAEESAELSDTDFDLEDIASAAKEEGELNVYNNSSSVEDVAANFSDEFGIDTTGTKAETSEMVEKVTREVDSGNVTVSVIQIEDGAALVGQLLDRGYVQSWVPSDLESKIDGQNADPLAYVWRALTVAYNPDVYPKGCPVDNMWELTDPEWKGKVAFQDPRLKTNLLNWFIELTNSGATPLEDAYKDYAGEALDTDEDNAGWEFIQRLAQNEPILTDSDSDAAAATGASGQDDPPLSILSSAKYIDAEEDGNSLAVCDTLKPWVGVAYPKYMAIVSDAPAPNAAKLWVHYVLTEEGIEPELEDGGFSANTEVPPASDNDPEGLEDWGKQLLPLLPKNNGDYWDGRQTMSDFWQINADS